MMDVYISDERKDTIVQCRWCFSIVLEVSLRGDSGRVSVGKQQASDAGESAILSIDDDDISIESVVFDRFKAAPPDDGRGLFERCSNIIGIEQPICHNCARDIQQQLSTGIRDWRDEGRAYERLLVRNSRERGTTDDSTCGKDSVFYEKECDVLEKELKALEHANRFHGKVREIEDSYWESFNVLNLHLHDAANLRDALQLQMDQSNHCMESSMPGSRHVLVDMLDISTDGLLGSISGCRLGVSGGESPPWFEINTAWGQAVLLLDIVRELMSIQFNGGQVILDPRGSYSRIFEQDKGYYELYGPVNKLLCLGFDKGQVLFLQCIQQVEAELQECRAVQSKEMFVLPYPIQGDKVGGCSIRYSFSRDRVWTQALGNMLLNLKECLCQALDFQGIVRSQSIMPSQKIDQNL